MAAGAAPFLREVETTADSARRRAGRLAWNLAAVADAERLGMVSAPTARRLERALNSRVLRPFAFAALWTLVAVLKRRQSRTRHRIECEMTTVSAAMREHGIERVDLLKIDAEGAEWPTLRGIEASDWPRIHQLVLEVHGEALTERIRMFLSDKGYTVAVDSDGWCLPELMGFRMLYARR
jgi:FkbM family methyltransferase